MRSPQATLGAGGTRCTRVVPGTFLSGQVCETRGFSRRPDPRTAAGFAPGSRWSAGWEFPEVEARATVLLDHVWEVEAPGHDPGAPRSTGLASPAAIGKELKLLGTSVPLARAAALLDHPWEWKVSSTSRAHPVATGLASPAAIGKGQAPSVVATVPSARASALPPWLRLGPGVRRSPACAHPRPHPLDRGPRNAESSPGGPRPRRGRASAGEPRGPPSRLTQPHGPRRPRGSRGHPSEPP